MDRAVTTIRDLLNAAHRHLVTHNVPNGRRNAEWMLCATLGISMLDLYVRSGESLDPADIDRYWRCVERRAQREPLQYILGNTEFMSLPFRARAGVFVPRPDTEVLVEHAEKKLRALPLHDPALVLDLCCGSGVIGVSIAKRVPNAGVTAVDASEAAVELTADNAALNEVSDRVRLVHDDAIDYLDGTTDRFAAILCNPPYIASGDLAGLPREVRDHEPMLALDGGPDGLNFYRRAIPRMMRCLLPRAFVMVEIGDTQGAAVAELFRGAGFTDVGVIVDLAGRDRVVSATRDTLRQ
ncbi:MAG TPA: peptide chain release factor N(5)-glutamine methyltransferase [Candidatus Krumholzibacteria bacterium]|nr:peptide chain release factor N(5)-glutamine methyltransferase [Candidatus Krumholzibacteria bacterium]